MRRVSLDLPRADLLLASGVAAASCLAVLASHSTTVRIVPGLLLALVLPGYAVSCALLPQRRPASQRVLLALGLSLAVAVVTAVVLDRTPWGLSQRSWAVALAGVVVAASGFAFRKRVGPDPDSPRPLEGPDRGVGRVAALAVAMTIAGFAVAALALARLPVDSRQASGYTVLWTRPTSPATPRFIVGVASSERQATSYRVVALVGTRTVFERRIELAPGERWTAGGIVRPPSFPVVVRILLYRSDATAAYRHVSLTLPGNAA